MAAMSLERISANSAERGWAGEKAGIGEGFAREDEVEGIALGGAEDGVVFAFAGVRDGLIPVVQDRAIGNCEDSIKSQEAIRSDFDNPRSNGSPKPRWRQARAIRRLSLRGDVPAGGRYLAS